MRILHVLEATLGGTRRYLEDVAAALGPGADNGLIYSLHRADGGFLTLLDRLRAAGWQLFHVDMRRAIDPLRDARCARAVRAVYRSFAPDVVHAHSSKAGALARIATLGMRRRPALVYAPHAIAANLSRAYAAIEAVLARRLDIMTAVTESERDELCALNFFPPAQIRVAVPTVDARHFAPRDRATARRALGLGDQPRIVAIGRLTEQKDPLAFVHLASQLRDAFPDLRARWIGDGELRSAMEAQIARFGLGSCIEITGWLDDVRPQLAAADLFVSTSRYESFGYVTAEALAMERPVIATRVTGSVDVVQTNRDEQLFALGDRRDAVEKATRVLREPAFAAEIARRGRAFVNAAFSSDATRRGLLSAYDAALALRRAPHAVDGVSDIEPISIERTRVSTDA